MGRRDRSGSLTQSHYALPSKPWLVTQVNYNSDNDDDNNCNVTQVYQPRESRMTSLVYDDTDRLIFVKINQVS